MFLALKEMRYSKLRYGLIVGIMFLIAYVVFMLSGLATGLSAEFKMVIDDWNPGNIILSQDANKTFAASQLSQGDLDRVDASEKAALGLYSGAIAEGDEQENITVFGTENDAFLLPEVTEGRMFDADDEIIISQNLADDGYKIGDAVTIGSSDTELKIVGIYPTTYYATTPVIYTTLDTWTALKYGNQPFASEDEKPINAIAVKEDAKLDNSTGTTLEMMDKDTFIDNMPGYSAQNLTLTGMIYFLFVIAAAIVGIFMYVITLQKTAIFGVMKAQGISNGFIAKSIVAQSFFVGVIGVAIAFVLAYLTSFVLPDAMPFAIAWSQWGIYSLVLLIVAILGGLFSIRTVTKVDPITAIGG